MRQHSKHKDDEMQYTTQSELTTFGMGEGDYECMKPLRRVELVVFCFRFYGRHTENPLQVAIAIHRYIL
jgi:hypothetical protein